MECNPLARLTSLPPKLFAASGHGHVAKAFVSWMGWKAVFWGLT